MVYFLFAFSSALGMFSTVLSKKFQTGFKMDMFHFMMYNLINAFAACIYFFFASGFSVNIDQRTVLFASVYALIVITVLITALYSLSHFSVSLSGLTGSSGSIILSSLFGILVLGEAITLNLVMAIGLMLLAVVLPYSDILRVKMDKASLVICCMQFLVGGAATIFSKVYAIACGASDSVSLFFLTNVIIFVLCFLVCVWFYATKKCSASEVLHTFSKGQVLNIVVRTAISNIGSVLSVVILSQMDVSVYTVVGSAFSFVSGGILSKFYFKEDMPVSNIIAIALAVVAIIIK